jgi:hypothetical protein
VWENSFNPEADTAKILICWQLRKIVPGWKSDIDYFQQGLQTCLHINCCGISDPLLPAPSSCFAVETPNPQSLGPSAFLVETEVTLENNKGDPNAPERAAEGDTQMET